MAEDEEELKCVIEDPDTGAGPAFGPDGDLSPSSLSEVRRRNRHIESLAEEGVEAPVRAPASEAEDASVDSLHKFWHRAGWLVILLMFQSTSSVVLEHFEMLIRSHPVVIYFLTMLVGAGGNAGSQSTVLVVRRLALAAVGGKDGQEHGGDARSSLRRIVGSEVSVGARLAGVLFCASFVRCIVFQVRGVECIAICLSMLCIVFTSTLLGTALPLLLSRFRLDPAHAGAAIQVIMDICGVTLTCVVSCLVLGLPLSGTHPGALAASVGGSSDALTGPDHLAEAHSNIQHAGVRRGLRSFGTDLSFQRVEP